MILPVVRKIHSISRPCESRCESGNSQSCGSRTGIARMIARIDNAALACRWIEASYLFAMNGNQTSLSPRRMKAPWLPVHRNVKFTQIPPFATAFLLRFRGNRKFLLLSFRTAGFFPGFSSSSLCLLLRGGANLKLPYHPTLINCVRYDAHDTVALLIPWIALQSDYYNENFNRNYCNA